MNEGLAGYDVLVWIDDDGDVVCCGYTEEGEKFLGTISRGYENGMVLEILAHPDTIRKLAPPHLRIGCLLYGTKNVVALDNSPLH